MKNLRLNKVLVGIVFVMGVSFSDIALAGYVITSNNNCKVTHWNPQPDETATWSGECLNGYTHGQGTLQWYKGGKENGTYIGGRKQGNQHGKGTFIWPTGSKFEGTYEDDKTNGIGRFVYVKNDPAISYWSNRGEGFWRGDEYIVQGFIYHHTLKKAMTDQEYLIALQEQSKRLNKVAAIEAEIIRKEAEAKVERIKKEAAEVKAKAEQEKQLAEQKEKELIASLKACGSRTYDEKAGITAEDFGNCDKVNTNEFVGLVLYKQNGRYFDMQCRNGTSRDYTTTSKNLINNFANDKCWKALHLLPNSCELDDYRGQCNANKKPHGVGYQYYSYAESIGNTNRQIFRGMFSNGNREGFGSYFELRSCGFFGCAGQRSSGNAWFKNNQMSYDNCSWNLKECETKPAREAEQARKEKEAYDRKVANFRKNLKAGDDATAGMVIEIKGNLIKIQTNDTQCSQRDYDGNCKNWIKTPVEKWVKRSELYPR